MTYDANYIQVIKDMKVEETAKAMTLLDERLSQGGLVLAMRREISRGEPIEGGCVGSIPGERYITYYLDFGTLTSLTHYPPQGVANVHLKGVEFIDDFLFSETRARDTRFNVPYKDLSITKVCGREVLVYDWGVVVPGAEVICPVLGIGPAGDYNGIKENLAESDMVVKRDVMRRKGRRKGKTTSIFYWRDHQLVLSGKKYNVIPVSVLLEKVRGKEPKDTDEW
jgi:hypothetical protein